MRHTGRLSWGHPWVATLALGFLPATSAMAAPLTGQLTDAATGLPIAHAEVRVLGLEQTTHTDAEGRWAFDLPQGVYELGIVASVFGEEHRSRLVNQHVPQYKQGKAHVYTQAFLDRGHPVRPDAPGLPSFSGAIPPGGPDALSLPTAGPQASSPVRYTIPASLPATIRVGRRQDGTGRQGCTDAANPIIAIEEVTFDEYVKGVLPPEIGVFRNLAGASEVYKAFAIAARSYGVYFVLRYDESNRRRIGRTVPPNGFDWFHIDDTACNQRYEDQRLEITSAAADAVASTIMVKRGETTTIDKYEYAASCGKHGSRPAYQTALVPDQPGTNPCVGSWCGHNTCAAHEDNPALAAGNRCLVRGICQWGAAAWGVAGKDYLWMMEHYQPNTALVQLGQPQPAVVVLTGYVYEDSNDITGTSVPGVSVRLSDGQVATSDNLGAFRFGEVPLALGTVSITAEKDGYVANTIQKQLEAGVTNWGSIQLARIPVVPAEDASPGGGEGLDAGLGTDTGVFTPSRDTGPTAPPQRQGLGPIIGPSGGARAACSAAAPAGGPLAMPWEALVALGVVAGAGRMARRRPGR